MYLLVLVCAYAIGSVAGLLAHVAGLWIVGRLLGFAIPRVTVGAGPVWYEGRLGATAVELSRYPIEGEVQHLVDPTRTLASNVLSYAGVAANLALLGVAELAVSQWSEPPWDALAPGLSCAQIAIICICLSANAEPERASLGLHAVAVVFDPWSNTDKLAAMLRPYRRPGDPQRSARPSGLARAILRFDAATDRAATARDVLRELDRGSAPRADTLLALDQLVTRQLLHGDAGVAGRLDELSRRALELAPDLATLRGSRGACLVELGRWAEGKPLLAPLAEGAPSFDSLLSRLFLARAEHGLGDTAEARRLVEAARAALAASPDANVQRLLDRVDAETAVPRPARNL